MKVRRWIRAAALTVGVVAAIVVVVLIAVLTVDLGPSLRERAERAGSKLIDRPMHIGRLGIRLRSGAFVVEDLRIEGLTPKDQPFFTAKRIDVSLYWWTFFRTREVLIKSIDMSDWDMQVELKDGRDSFIDTSRFKSKDPNAKRSYTVTLARVDAVRGRFTYIDHGTWSTVSPNLTVHVDHDSGEYRGRANFTGGTVKIKDYLPMRDDMRCAFKIEGGKVRLPWIDLTTDGSHSVVSGDVDFGNWPEMLFRVRTDQVDFPRMKQIFFADEKFRVTGEGKFTGSFHLYKGGGRDLNGSFSSPQFTINAYRFTELAGDLRWLPHSFNLTNASARFHGGTSHFTYAMAPLSDPAPAVARFDASYENVDLASLTDFLKTQGLRLSGRATGRNVLEWPLGRFSEHRGEGQISVRPPAGAALYSRASQPLPQLVPAREAGAPAPANVGAVPNLGYLPIAGSLRYQYGPQWVDVGASSIATPDTYVEFRGRTAYGDRSAIDFYARSGDWQGSDRLLAAVITAFGSPTKTVSVGGYGEFTGRMLNSFRRPRIEGSFSGEQVRAFDVVWGRTRGKVVVDNGYVEVTDGIVTQGEAVEMRTDGRFSLSTPRDDRGEEINAVVTLKAWPMRDLRHAFDLDEYPIDGKMGGEYHVFGAYRRPFGYGKIAISDAAAYGEPFERGTGSMKLEGVGVRIEGIELRKGGGAINGSAYVSWDGRYSFNADVRNAGIPVEQMAALKFSGIPPLSGIIRFRSASGAGTFADPSYRIEGVQVADLFVGDEGIGQVTGTLAVQNRRLWFDLFAASGRLSVDGGGQIEMAPGANASILFHVNDTSLDPYIRAFEPRLSPFTTAIASGTVRVDGRLTDFEHLRVEASVERLDMKLFDYSVKNQGPLRLALVDNFLHLGGTAAGTASPMRLVGADTALSLSGDVDLRNQRVAVKAVGDANLGILQGLFPDILSSGRARVSADIQGPVRNPSFAGRALVQNGRIRYFSLPHSIDAINGPVTFTAGAIWFGDPSNPGMPLTAQVGGGPVTFGGRLVLDGFAPVRWEDVTASGTNVHLRYPEGFNSIVDAELRLSGPYTAPTLSGNVTVKSALYARPIDPGLLGLAAAAGAPAATPASSAATWPLRFEIGIHAPRALRVQNNLADMVASADLRLTGTYDHPQMDGQATVDRGYATLEGRRYQVTQGIINFYPGARIEPWFDIETETHVRIPGQTYVINLQLGGTFRKFTYQISSDPPLPEVEAVSLLFGDVRSTADVQNPELAQLQRPNAASQQLLQTRVQQLILSPFSYNAGRVVEQAFGLNAFQLTPSLLDYETQRLSPTARLTLGKQISNRAYLTISRSLYAIQEDVVFLLQYDQTDRMSWVVSRNEDGTYSVDFRVRHVF